MSESKPSILYLDDEESNLNVFNATFKRDYKIFTTTNYKEALTILKKEEIKIILVDQKMPEITGIEFLKKINDSYLDIVRIIITAYTDIDLVINAFNEVGIYQFISKPWEAKEVQQILKNALEKFKLQRINRELVEQLKGMNAKLEETVKQRTSELRKANNSKDQLFKIISEEIATPVKSLNSYLDQLINFGDLRDLEKSKKQANEISKTILETRFLLDNLSRWSSLQIEKIQPHNEECQLNICLDFALESLRLLALDKKVSLAIDTDKKVIAEVDTAIIDYIITALTHVCLKFTEETKNIDIKLVEHKNTFELSFKSSDGKDTDLLKQYFDAPDILSSPSGKSNLEIGLAISNCLAYAKAIKGTLEVSLTNQGFTITLIAEK